MFEHDDRVVMTLDAGGTNFVFSAIAKGEEVVRPITIPSVPDDSLACLERIVEGFRRVKAESPVEPSAISFAFAGHFATTLSYHCLAFANRFLNKINRLQLYFLYVL